MLYDIHISNIFWQVIDHLQISFQLGSQFYVYDEQVEHISNHKARMICNY
jgi:hypothetical protein